MVDSSAIKDGLRDWKQGDVVRPAPFIFVADGSVPATPPSIAVVDADPGGGWRSIETGADGIVVISQTCDIVSKNPDEAPFVVFAALTALSGLTQKSAAKGDRPRYAPVPQLGDEWFADLDQIVTVEKAALVGIAHEHGVLGTKEEADFGDKVARKFGPDNTLVLTDNFGALNANLSILRENNAKINKIVLTPSNDANAKQTISPWDSQLWSKSVNGKFQIQTQVTSTVGGTATTPSTTTTNGQTVTVQPTSTLAKFTPFEDTQALAANYLGLKVLDDMGMLTGIEAFKGSSITTNIAQGKALSALFNKYSTEFYLNIRDTSANISKNIDFIASNNKKLTGITQIGNITPLEITREQNKKADLALSKMKNPYSIKSVA